MDVRSLGETNSYRSLLLNNTLAKIKIEDLVNGGNTIWEEIMTRYNEDGSMNKKYRKAMNEAIVQYALVKDIYIDLESMENIAYQICKLFPTETASSYFVKIGKGYSGSLYNLYHRKRSNNNKERKVRRQIDSDDEEIDLPVPTESISVLKSDGQTDTVYMEKWKETFEYRQKKIPQYETFDDFINEWPIITKEIGPSLTDPYIKTAMIADEEKPLIVKLRQNIVDELPLSVTSLTVEDQDLFLVRWIRARDLDLDKATTMLRNSLKWRIEKRADDALNFKIHSFFTEYFVVDFAGTDKLGQPVFLLPLNEWDLRKVVNDADRFAEFDDFATHLFERLCKHIKDEHNKRRDTDQPAITQVTLLIDVKNYSYMQLINIGAIKKILQVAAIYEAHYPEILYRGVFINCPHYFGMFITMLKPVLAQKTLSKLMCYPKMSEWQIDAKEMMDTAQIPERYGGSKSSE